MSRSPDMELSSDSCVGTRRERSIFPGDPIGTAALVFAAETELVPTDDTGLNFIGMVLEL